MAIERIDFNKMIGEFKKMSFQRIHIHLIEGEKTFEVLPEISDIADDVIAILRFENDKFYLKATTEGAEEIEVDRKDLYLTVLAL